MSCVHLYCAGYTRNSVGSEFQTIGRRQRVTVNGVSYAGWLIVGIDCWRRWPECISVVADVRRTKSPQYSPSIQYPLTISSPAHRHYVTTNPIVGPQHHRQRQWNNRDIAASSVWTKPVYINQFNVCHTNATVLFLLVCMLAAADDIAQHSFIDKVDKTQLNGVRRNYK